MRGRLPSGRGRARTRPVPPGGSVYAASAKSIPGGQSALCGCGDRLDHGGRQRVEPLHQRHEQPRRGFGVVECAVRFHRGISSL